LGDSQPVHAEGLLWLLEGKQEGEQRRWGKGSPPFGGDGADQQRKHR